MKILIVDDSKAMQKILAKSMVSLGYQNEDFFYADDGLAAMQAIETKQPDLVLCDLHMPNKSGLELIESLRASGNQTKVILVSIDEDNELRKKVTEVGGNAYLKKPFTAAQLYTVVNEVMGKEKAQTVTKVECNLHWALPSLASVERVFSSLAMEDIKLGTSQYQNVDYTRAPFCGGTLMDEVNNVVLAVFMDVVAANLMAAVLQKQTIIDAAALAKNRMVSETVKQSVKSMIGLLTGICRPLNSEQLLVLHAEQYAEDANQHLKPHLDAVADNIVVWTVTTEDGVFGNILLVKSANIS